MNDVNKNKIIYNVLSNNLIRLLDGILYTIIIPDFYFCYNLISF